MQDNWSLNSIKYNDYHQLKIMVHTKKQENVTLNKEKYHSIESVPEMAEMNGTKFFWLLHHLNKDN